MRSYTENGVSVVRRRDENGPSLLSVGGRAGIGTVGSEIYVPTYIGDNGRTAGGQRTSVVRMPTARLLPTAERTSFDGRQLLPDDRPLVKVSSLIRDQTMRIQNIPSTNNPLTPVQHGSPTSSNTADLQSEPSTVSQFPFLR